jgi:hypothetical protein
MSGLIGWVASLEEDIRVETEIWPDKKIGL